MIYRFRSYYAIFFICLLLPSGCASILNGNNQTVLIKTDSYQNKVYVDNEYAGKGEFVSAKLKRDFNTKQIKVEREGYKPEFAVNLQQKKSFLYVFSWIPFGVLLYPPLYDRGRKAYNYHKEKEVSPVIKVNKKKENQKYIYLKNTSFVVKKEDFVFKLYKYNKYYNNKKASGTTQSTEDLELDNSIFTETLNNMLKENGFVDTTNTIFKGKTNTLYVSATVNGLTLNEIYTLSSYDHHPQFLTAEATIEWEILDFYEQSKYKSEITTMSGEFSPKYTEDNKDFVKLSIEDAIKTSFLQFIDKKEVQDLIIKESFTDMISQEKIVIPTPGKKSYDLSTAQSSTVTILNGKSHGSGCVVSEEGHIITNYHVIAGKEKLQVIFNDGEKADAEIVRINEFADLALLKVNKVTSNVFLLSNKSNYLAGDEVFAIGTPTSLELGQTLSKGIVSGIRDQKNLQWIQTDVSVNPGNSGGSLVNRSGELVGIVNSKLMGFGIEGISFCIPAKDVFKLLSISYN